MSAIITGKGKYGTRQSLMVTRLDRKAVTKAVREVLRAQWGVKADKVANYSADSLVIGRRPGIDDWGDRDTLIVCPEGVSFRCDNRGLISVPVISGFEMIFVDVSATRLWRCATEEQVDLADFIRVFGDRLETNFDLAYDALTKALDSLPGEYVEH